MRYRISIFLAALLLSPFAGVTGQAPFWRGLWRGFAVHEGSRSYVAFQFRVVSDTVARVTMTIPAMHATQAPMGDLPVRVEGNRVRIGPFDLQYDREAQTLSGVLPSALVPVYDIPVTLERVESLQLPPRRPIEAPAVQPAWTFEAGTPLWAGATFDAGLVYAGGDDGVLHAIDATTGAERWAFRAGGPIRSRARVVGGAVYLQADDGVVYRLDAADGSVAWQTPLVEASINRVPPGSPASRYDLFAADVVVDRARLYVGTHDGKLVALDAADGHRLWEFTTGDAVLAAPAVVDGVAYFGSFDHHVYAVNAETGALLWRHDTGAPVTSTPAVADGNVIVGSRSYDVLGLDADDGAVQWKRYVWFSWIESPASLFDRVAYVGSSDATKVFALDPRTGETRWQRDVCGRALGQPAVTDTHVYVGTSGQTGYHTTMHAAVVALDRMSGNPAWQFTPETQTESGMFGFTGSPAVGAGLVFATDLAGKVYALRQ